MRKAVTALLLVVVILLGCIYAAAEDLSAMTTEDLLDLRLQINNELVSRKADVEIQEGAIIADLFPDRFLAMKVRDAVGAISTSDPITQDELDSIKTISINGNTAGETEEFCDLTGIEYLRNLEVLRVVRQPGCTKIPDAIGNCIYLRDLDFRSSGIKTLPASICDLEYLESIDACYSELDSLPDDIGNLQQLKKLNISYTKVTVLPASIRNLDLEKFYRDGLDLD